jgi:hypothetical protein
LGYPYPPAPGDVVGFDTEGVLDDLGGELAIIGADRAPTSTD